jgi:hypothetical protein
MHHKKIQQMPEKTERADVQRSGHLDVLKSSVSPFFGAFALVA